jgi:hypothetical protein
VGEGAGRQPALRKMFFFEKKNQKTFARAVADPPESYAKGKSFLLLFFKKEDLPFFL